MTVTQTVRELLARYGYQYIVTPVVEPTDLSLPAPAPVDELTHPELVLGETEGTVALPDGTLVTIEQLCLGTPAAG